MSVKRYNRNFEKKIGKNSINSSLKEVIDEELERARLDKTYEDAYNQEEKKYNFISNYLRKNNPPECNNCYLPECFFYTSLSKCDRIGKELGTISNEKGVYYKIKKIPKININIDESVW